MLLSLFDNARNTKRRWETVAVEAHGIGDGMVHVTVGDRGTGIPVSSARSSSTSFGVSRTTRRRDWG